MSNDVVIKVVNIEKPMMKIIQLSKNYLLTTFFAKRLDEIRREAINREQSETN